VNCKEAFNIRATLDQHPPPPKTRPTNWPLFAHSLALCLAPGAEFLFGKCKFKYPPGQLFSLLEKFSQKANFEFSKMK
jgi:hypothetical protein